MQFTEEWDFSDYKESEVAGQYSFYTNVWDVRAIMYQLVTLSEGPSNHREPFMPDWNIALSRSPTYGLDIRAHEYSQTLTDLIFECLSEKPRCRPDLLGFKNRVTGGYAGAHVTDLTFEPYSDFEQSEPVASNPSGIREPKIHQVEFPSWKPDLPHHRLWILD